MGAERRTYPPPPGRSPVTGDEQVDPEEGLGRRAASGVLWLTAQKWVIRASGFVTLVVLTHQVAPKDFGVVAAAMSVIPLVYFLSDLGFSTYLLQADEVDQRSLSTAFWASLVAGALLSAGLLGVAPLLADAFGLPELAPVLRALVLSVVPTVLAAVPMALLRRAMAFRVVALQALVASLLAQVVAVAVALLGGGVWALVSQLVVTQWVVALLAWGRVRWLPSFTVSGRLFARMASFGVKVSGFDLLGTTRMLLENWIIAVTLGPTALGLLNVAQRLVQVAQELVAASLVPVSTVVFAQVRGAVDRLRTSYLKALGLAYAMVSPVMILLVVTAPVLIPLLFGGKWRASVPPAQALAVAGIITLGAMLDHGLFYGLGRPGAWLGYAVVVDTATVATTAVAVRWGLVGVAVGFVVVATLATVARWVLVSRVMGMSVPTVARPFVTVLVPTAITTAVGLLAMNGLDGLDSPALEVALCGLVVAIVDLALLRVLAVGIIRDALGVLPLPARPAAAIRRLLRLDLLEPA